MIEDRKILSSIPGPLPSTLTDVAPGMIRTPNEWAGLNVAKAELFPFRFEFFKFVRCHVALDAQLPVRRLQILSNSNDIDVILS